MYNTSRQQRGRRGGVDVLRYISTDGTSEREKKRVGEREMESEITDNPS